MPTRLNYSIDFTNGFRRNPFVITSDITYRPICCKNVGVGLPQEGEHTAYIYIGLQNGMHIRKRIT